MRKVNTNLDLSPISSPLLAPLRAAVVNLGGRVERLDPWSDQVVRVYPPTNEASKSGPVLIGCGATANYPLNSAVAASVARDKSHTAHILSQAGFQTPEGGHVFLSHDRINERPAGKEIEAAKNLTDKLGYPVYCKPLTGSKGDGVSFCQTLDELEAALIKLSQYHNAARIEAPVHGTEYRLFVSCGKIEFAYRKDFLSLKGDGQSSLLELATAAFGETMEPERLSERLHRGGHIADRIPRHGERITPFAAANLTYGSQIADILLTVPEHLTNWALKAAATLDLEVCGFDVISQTPLTEAPLSDLTILEANANPSLLGIWNLGHTDIAIEVWQRILQRAFSQKKPQSCA